MPTDPLVDFYYSCMSSIELCLGYLADALVDLDTVLERFDDSRSQSDLDTIVDLVDSLVDLVAQLQDGVGEDLAGPSLLDDQASESQ